MEAVYRSLSYGAARCGTVWQVACPYPSVHAMAARAVRPAHDTDAIGIGARGPRQRVAAQQWPAEHGVRFSGADPADRPRPCPNYPT